VGYHFFYPNEDKFLLRFANPVKTGSYFQYVCLSFLTIKTPGMRKFIMLSSLFFFSMAGYSQFVIFGAKAGVNFATVTGNALDDKGMHPSFHIGGLANFFLNDNFTIQPEVLYSGKGFKSSDQTYKFGYIDIPVLVQYKTPSGFFVEAGPQVGFLISAKVNSTDIKENMKSTDFSWVGGLGYKSAMGIGASARYDFGYTNVSEFGTLKNKTIMVSVFYTFGSNSQE